MRLKLDYITGDDIVILGVFFVFPITMACLTIIVCTYLSN